ncbi:MAG: SRPBCC domain-containing protein [Polyangia bacterium]|jgi:hypothetical protein|nr:SRPBCC domain-containing protein [Polyangia bacterium]
MARIATELTIAAPPPVVWRAFLDRARWKTFSSFHDLDPGRPLVEGARFWLGIRAAGPVPLPIKVKVLRRVEERELRWAGGGPGIRGEHWFLFEPEGEGWTRFRHGEDFTGPLGELLVRLGGGVARGLFESFNQGLARLVEPQPR